MIAKESHAVSKIYFSPRMVFENISEMSNVTITANSFDKIFISTFYWIISLNGLFFQVTVLIAAFKSKQYQGQQFYLFLINLCFADCFVYILYIFYAAPCAIFSSQVYGTVLGFLLGLFETVDFVAIVICTFVISLNRAMSISQSSFYNWIFRRQFCHLINISCWIIGIVVVILDYYLTTCSTRFDEKQFYFSFECTNPNNSPATSVASFIIYVGVYGVAVIYAFPIWSLWKKRNAINKNNQRMRNNMNKHKKRLFYQSLCIWLLLLLNVISKCVHTLMQIHDSGN